jgi:hypothetical protein
MCERSYTYIGLADLGWLDGLKAFLEAPVTNCMRLMQVSSLADDCDSSARDNPPQVGLFNYAFDLRITAISTIARVHLDGASKNRRLQVSKRHCLPGDVP